MCAFVRLWNEHLIHGHRLLRSPWQLHAPSKPVTSCCVAKVHIQERPVEMLLSNQHPELSYLWEGEGWIISAKSTVKQIYNVWEKNSTTDSAQGFFFFDCSCYWWAFFRFKPCWNRTLIVLLSGLLLWPGWKGSRNIMKEPVLNPRGSQKRA